MYKAYTKIHSILSFSILFRAMKKEVFFQIPGNRRTKRFAKFWYKDKMAVAWVTQRLFHLLP